MRKILLFIALFLTVTSEQLKNKKSRPLLSEDRPQFWFARGSRIPWDLTHFEFDQSMKNKDVRRHQESEPSLSRISGSQPHDFTKFIFNNPNLTNSQEDQQASENHQKVNQESSTDGKKPTFQMPFDRFELTKINLNQERFDCTWERCYRRTQGWRVQEPLYVDEPTWVQINSENFESPMSKSEPFFVTRGKRSLKLKSLNSLKNTIDNLSSDSTLDIEDKTTNTLTKFEKMDDAKTHRKRRNQEWDKLKSIIQKKDTAKESDKLKETLHVTEGRFKREDSHSNSPKVLKAKIIKKRSETESEKFLENIQESLKGSDHIGGKTKTSSYLQPRNKHSDILEILEEPFFISRGKKNNLFPFRDLLVEKFYLDQYVKELLSDLKEVGIFSETELGAKEKVFEKSLNNEVRRERVQNKNTDESGPNAKRGILEELNLQVDPFYVARG